MNVIKRMIEYTEKFSNPLTAYLCRYRSPDAICRVQDRKTGLKLKTKCGAVRMVTEVLHDRDYEIPRLPLAKGDVVIDIGANHGSFSLSAAFQGCTVFCFEPSTQNFALLVENVRNNQLLGEITPINKAVGAEAGEIKFYETDALGGGKSSTIKEHAESSQKMIVVACENLESFIEEKKIGRIRLLKLDCEGAEFDILKSLSPQTLAKIDAMVIEFHPGCYSMDDFFGFLLNLDGFHFALAEDKYCKRDIIRLVSKNCLLKAWNN